MTMKMTFRSYKSMLYQNMNMSICCIVMSNKEIHLQQLRGFNWYVIGLAETHITRKGEYDMEEGIKTNIPVVKKKEVKHDMWARFLLYRKAAEALIASYLNLSLNNHHTIKLPGHDSYLLPSVCLNC